MEDIALSIIEQWKEENNYEGSIPLSSVEVKYSDHEARIYTLFLNIPNTIVKIKAIKDILAWKIIELT